MDVVVVPPPRRSVKGADAAPGAGAAAEPDAAAEPSTAAEPIAQHGGAQRKYGVARRDSKSPATIAPAARLDEARP
ncbi:MAG: hypothetical protein GX607_09910 [Myxococcales bacterium]|nr:hypothetical protein [Myxococcales bacterium]